MGYLWAKYEGSHFLDHVPQLTRSRKKGALNISLKIDVQELNKQLSNFSIYLVDISPQN